MSVRVDTQYLAGFVGELEMGRNCPADQSGS